MWSLLSMHMTSWTPRLRGMLLGAVITTVAAPAVAQPVLSAPQERLSESCSDVPAHFAAFMAFLEVKLAIGDDQYPAWQAFIQEAREGAKAEEALCAPVEDSPEDPDGPAAVVQLLMQREAQMFASLQSSRHFRLALQGLLPTLRAEQQDRLPGLLFGPQRLMWVGDRCLSAR